jgi:hypothetical protein
MWNLFKAQLIAEYTPTTYNFADLNKVGKHGRYTEQLYRRHFDITSGGRLVPRPDVPIVFEAVSLIYSSQNRFNVNANSPLLSSQLRFDHTFYWTARIIDSPTAIIITLFPGIWTDIFFSPNFGMGARNWVDAVSMSMYLQKNTVIGIRISKLPPYLVTPWSGFCFKTFDSGLSAGAILNSIQSVVNAEISLMSAIIYRGDTTRLDAFKDAYSSIYSAVITPQLIEAANAIPSVYGSDFRGIDLTNQSGEAQEKVVGAITGLCNQFIASYQNAAAASGFGFGVDSQGKPTPNLTILVGVLGLEKEKEKWLEENRKGVVVINYNDIRYPLAKEYYERERNGVRAGRSIVYRIRYPYDDEYAQYEFFLGEDLVYSYTSRLYGIGISFSDYIRRRDPLFDITMKRAEDLIFNLLIQGTSVVFDARNLEREDRNKLQEALQRRIESRIQSEFLDEFDLLIDGRYYNNTTWTNEQNEEYNNRIRALKGISFFMKIFDYDELIPKNINFYSQEEIRNYEVLNQSIIDYIVNEDDIFFAIEQEYRNLEDYEASLEEITNRNRRAYLKELVYRKILENYDTNYVKERQRLDSDRISLIETIVDTQIRRFEDDRRVRENTNYYSRYNTDNYSIILN